MKYSFRKGFNVKIHLDSSRKHFRLIVTIIALGSTPSILSCKTLSNRNSSDVLECGPETRNLSYKYVKVISGDVEGLSINAKELEIEYKTTKGDHKFGLPVTSKGCIVAPKDVSGISVIDFSTKQGAQLNLSTDEKFIVQELKLESIPQLSAKSSCPREGLIVRDALPNSWTFSQQINLSLYRVVFQALDEKSGSIFPIFTKERYVNNLLAPSTFDITALPEGVYRLQLNIDAPLSKETDTSKVLSRDCPFVVIKSTPQIEGVEKSSGSQLHNIGDILPWKSVGQSSQLFLCKELKSNDICSAKANCMDEKSFKAVPYISSDEIGLFNFFVFSRDLAGNQSETKCSTLAFKSDNPLLTIKSDDPKLNNEFSYLDIPYSELNFEIDISHNSLPAESFRPFLECKVTASDETSVNCISDECKGKSLSSWQTCGASLRFRITESELPQSQKSSLLSIDVRLRKNDEIFSTRNKSIAYDKKRLTFVQKNYAFKGENFGTLTWNLSANGETFIQGTNLPKVDSNELVHTNFSLNEQIFTDYNSGKIYKYNFSKKGIPGSSEHTLYAREEGSWKILNIAYDRVDPITNIQDPNKVMPPRACQALYTDGLGDIWCAALGIRYHFDGKYWHSIHVSFGNIENFEIFNPQQCPEANSKLHQLAVWEKAGNLWYLCDGNLLVMDSDEKWTMKWPKGKDGLIVHNILVDSKTNIWIDFLNGRDLGRSFGKIDKNGMVNKLPRSELQKAVPNQENVLEEVESGVVAFQNELWNESEKRWGLRPLITNENRKNSKDYRPKILGSKDWEFIEQSRIYNNKIIPDFLNGKVYQRSFDFKKILSDSSQLFLPEQFIATSTNSRPKIFRAEDSYAIKNYLHNRKSNNRLIESKTAPFPKGLPEREAGRNGFATDIIYRFLRNVEGDFIASSANAVYLYQPSQQLWQNLNLESSTMRVLYVARDGAFWGTSGDKIFRKKMS
ncbi:MAG: hypothetical protein EOO45_09885 [Flavobacterium sp.]|nr:MAG: hypothetical protein EOO45_09885 [Flavobacterium sp.]